MAMKSVGDNGGISNTELNKECYTLFPNFNIFADLKQWAKDCERNEEFGFKIFTRDGFVKHEVSLPIEIGDKHFGIGGAIKFANAIKQVAYTQLRKEGKL